MAGPGTGEHPKKIWDAYVFLQPLKLATSNLVHKLGMGPKLAGVWAEKLVHNMSSGLPCQTQVLGPNEVGSEFGEYHSFPFMMMMQLCILRAIKTDRYTD